MTVKNQKSFTNGDTHKRIKCLNDCGFLMESHISDTKIRVVKCKKCGSISGPIAPPYVGEQNGTLGVFFGPKNDSTFTAVPEEVLEELFKGKMSW